MGEVVGFPAGATVVANLSPPELRGRYQGAFSMSWGVAFTIAPILGGEVLTRAGGPALWGTCFAIGIAVAAGHLVAAEPRRRRLRTLASAAAPPPA
jgi:MFS family permease